MPAKASSARPPSKKGRRAPSLLPKPNANKVLKLKHSKKMANKARDASAREGINGQDNELREALMASNKEPEALVKKKEVPAELAGRGEGMANALRELEVAMGA